MRLGWPNTSGNQWRGPDGPSLTRTFNDVVVWVERPYYQALGADIPNMGVANTVNFVTWATPETDEHYLNPDNNTTIVLPPSRERWLVEAQACGLVTMGAIGSAVMGWQVNAVNTGREARVYKTPAGAAYLCVEFEKVIKGGDSLRVYAVSDVAAAVLEDLEVSVKLTPVNG